MSLIKHCAGSIKAVYACVPVTIVENRTVDSVFSEEEKEQVLGHIGIEQRHVCRETTCASDLCYAAAHTLMTDCGIEPESIDLLLFVSQSGDYPTPATACLLQERLGLPKSTAAMDIMMACSGYVYALSTAFAFCSCEGINRILLLAGDTPSKIVSSKDRATSLLPGDAGTATLIEAEAVESTFSLNSDGARAESLIVRGGGFRHPASPNSLMDVTYEDGSVRNAHQLEMNGLEVFNFTVREVSKDIARVLEEQGLTEQDVDYFLFHQANAFILNFILKKRKIPKEKVPASLTHYGNTVCASIPLTWVTACGGKKMDGTKLLLCGYGGGLSWGTALLDVEGCCVGELIVADDL